MRNGRITGYNLTCFITDTSRIGQISDIYPPQDMYTLSGFRPGTMYTCQVTAMNSAGSGPAANITAQAPEDSKHIIDVFFSHRSPVLVPSLILNTGLLIEMPGSHTSPSEQISIGIAPPRCGDLIVNDEVSFL